MFYQYRQCNSGGHFVLDEKVGLGILVVIEADDAEHADYLADRLGIYFNGCADGYDCYCCGDRWESAETLATDEGTKVPEYFGRTLSSTSDEQYKCFVHYLDGRVVRMRVEDVPELLTR